MLHKIVVFYVLIQAFRALSLSTKAAECYWNHQSIDDVTGKITVFILIIGRLNLNEAVKGF